MLLGEWLSEFPSDWSSSFESNCFYFWQHERKMEVFAVLRAAHCGSCFPDNSSLGMSPCHVAAVFVSSSWFMPSCPASDCCGSFPHWAPNVFLSPPGSLFYLLMTTKWLYVADLEDWFNGCCCCFWERVEGEMGGRGERKGERWCVWTVHHFMGKQFPKLFHPCGFWDLVTL